MRVQVVQDQHDGLGRRVMHVGQVAHPRGEIHPGPSLRDLGKAVGRERLDGDEDVGRAVADVLVVEAFDLTRLRRDRHSRFADQLGVQFVDADHRAQRVGRPLVDIQHVLHGSHELGILARRDDPLLLQPRLEFVFLRVRRTVSDEIRSTTPRSTRRSARSRIVQCVRPAGGCEQAIVTSWASPLPSRRRSYTRSGRLGSSAASKPSITKRSRTRYTVAAPQSRALPMSSSLHAGPRSLASALSRLRARVSFRAAAWPLARSCSSQSRSSWVSVTIYFNAMGQYPPSMLNSRSHKLNEQMVPSVADRSPSGSEPVVELGSPRSLLTQPEQLPGHTPYLG